MEYGDVKERIIELTKLLAKYEELINNKTMTELELNEPINLVKALGSNKQVIYSSEICVYGG